MSDTLTQDTRIGKLTTPLGQDTLVLSRIHAGEALSECFTYTIDALSEKSDLDFNPALGKHCTVTVKTYDGERHFDGILTEALFIGASSGITGPAYYSYQLTLRPWLWLLSHRADCRIYHEKKVNEIILDVFQRAGFSGDVESKLQESYPKLEYCVQYRETDFVFVSRLMEEFGIYYYFEHEDGKHTMVLADSTSAHKPIPTLPGGKIPFRYTTERIQREEEVLFEWESAREFCSGKFSLNDYDYMKPNADLKGKAEGQESYELPYEMYDYPGRYIDRGDGDKLAKVRLQSEQARDHRRKVGGDAVSLFPGGRISVTNNTVDSKTDFLVLRAEHTFSEGVYRSGTADDGTAYQGRYELLPAEQQFRAPQVTPPPKIYGVQTARVVPKKGDESEEISVDEHGRIFVHFFWDRHNDLSCPVRIAQPWAQKKWGHIVIPRIGQEVVVDFLEGDPDRPLVTATVYNGDNKVPYDLPANKTQSGIKTNSSKGGNGYNEFMFEDKKGSEKIRMHAQLDHEVVIENSETWTIGNVFKTPQGKPSRKTEIKHGDDELTIDTGDRKADIKQRNDILTIDMGNRTTTLKMGNDSLKCDLGSITHEAMQKIELKVGQSSITIDQMGVTIKGMVIKIEGQLQVQVKGLMTQVNGDAMLMLKGGITMIN